MRISVENLIFMWIVGLEELSQGCSSSHLPILPTNPPTGRGDSPGSPF